MGNKVKERPLDTKSARAKLPIRAKPYYRSLGPTLQLGYRRNEGVGRWVVRLLVSKGIYKVERIAAADDKLEANGIDVLSYAQALDRVRELHRQRADDDDDAPKGPYTIRQAIADYLSDVLHGKASEDDTRKRLAAYVPESLASKECAKLSRKELLAWHRKLAEAMPRSRTKRGAPRQNYREVDLTDPEIARKRRVSGNRILGQLKAALNHAAHVGKITDDRAPWRNVKPFKGVNTARVRFLKNAEAKRLVNGSAPDFRPMVQAALLTGCRYSELCRLKVSDFDPDAGTVFIQQSKSDKSRHVVLTDEGQAFVEQMTAGRTGPDPMFRRVWGPSQQKRRMEAASKRAKIDPPINFHALRHTWASLAVMAGMPLMVVAKNLGHADTRMVEKHYGHLAPSYIADEIRRAAPRYGFDKASNVRRMDKRA
jgi:integrase